MPQTNTELATFGGGCFWCLEAVFEALEGVERVTSGFSGGKVKNPSYYDVCSGNTGHAEVVQIEFDPERIGYRDLVEIFFAFHDPTTLNQQGPDHGTQYRSAIYVHSPEQERIAREVIATLSAANTWKDPVVTEVAPFDAKAFEIRAREVAAGEGGVAGRDVGESRLGELALGEIEIIEARLVEDRAARLHLREDRVLEHGPREVGPLEQRSFETRPGEIGAREIFSGEVFAGKVRAGEIRSHRGVRFPPRLPVGREDGPAVFEIRHRARL